MLTTYLHPASKLGISGTVSLLTYMPSFNRQKQFIYSFVYLFIPVVYDLFNNTIRDSGCKLPHLLVTKYNINKIQNWNVCGRNFPLLISTYSPDMCQEEDQIRSCTVWTISYCDPIITMESHPLFYVPGISNVWWINTKSVGLPTYFHPSSFITQQCPSPVNIHFFTFITWNQVPFVLHTSALLNF
jgi:hypothetical protein